MASISNQFRNQFIDWMFRGQALALNGAASPAGSGPAFLYFGLFSTTPTPTGNGVEVAAAGYLRVAIASSLANWAGTQGAGSTTASSGATGQTSNNIQIIFDTPGNWGMVTGVGLFDSLTGGKLLFYNALSVPREVVSASVPPAIPAGQFVLNIK